MRRATSWLRLLVAIALLTGCSDAPDLPTPLAAAGLAGPRKGGTLRFSIVDDVRTLDPAIAYDEYSLYAEHLVYDQLVGYDTVASGHPLELRPMLAESWTISEDRLTYTFTLRANAAYEDGSPIVADDFISAFERVLDPKIPSPAKSFFEGIDGAADRIAGKAPATRGLSAPDLRTLVIRLAKPDESFLLVLAMPFIAPMPRAWTDKQGDRVRDKPLASGPFRLVEWRQGERMVFERNPHYWDASLPYLDRIEMSLQVSRDVAVLKFLRGELDSLERLSSDKFVLFAKAPAWKPYVRLTPLTNVYGELMDVTKPPFTDKRVRQAMNYAINKEDSKRVYNGRMVISHGLLPPSMPGYDPTMKPYPHDPAKARALLAEAGYPHGFDIDYYTLHDEIAGKLAQSMQADLAEVGVRMRIHEMTFPTYLSAVGRHQLSFAYSAWIMDFPDPWNFLESKFHSRFIAPTNSTNDNNYSNPEVDRLLDAARVEPDRAKRLAMYHQVELILYDDAPWIWHYHSMASEVLQPYVKGYDFHPVYLRDYRTTWLDKPGTTPVTR